MKNFARRLPPFMSLIYATMALFLINNSFGICYLVENKNDAQKKAVIAQLIDVKLNPTTFEPTGQEWSTLPYGGPDVFFEGKVIPRYVSDTSDDTSVLKLKRNNLLFIVGNKRDYSKANGCFNPGNSMALVPKVANPSSKERKQGYTYHVIKKYSFEFLDRSKFKYSQLCIYDFYSMRKKSLICYMD